MILKLRSNKVELKSIISYFTNLNHLTQLPTLYSCIILRIFHFYNKQYFIKSSIIIASVYYIFYFRYFFFHFY